MSEKKISITRESVESMDKPMLKDVVYSLYNDNVVLLNKVKESPYLEISDLGRPVNQIIRSV